ncbi:MAG: Lrp/AsnC family transcriptional regulator [Acidimicrobiia bacterium]|nr:Lrp/AsnC family transcriptional regulator [Acidimicrobiia bacterium]
MTDELDREILRALQIDGRMTHRELGKVVGLSANATGARVQRLIERGVIVGFQAVVDHAKLGRSMEATVDVWLNDDRQRSPLMELVADDDRVVECFHLTGPLDFRLRARVASADDLNALLNRLRDEGGVRQTDSRLVLEHIPTQ